MANNTVRLPLRNRTGPQRPKPSADENAVSKHVRQSSVTLNGAASASHSFGNVHALKNIPQRAALGEVTTTAVNRKDIANNKLTGKGKDTAETTLKRTRSSSLAAATGAQRVPLGPGKAQPNIATQTAVQSRVAGTRIQRPPIKATQRVPAPKAPIVEVEEDEDEDSMEIEDEDAVQNEVNVAEDPTHISSEEVENMVEVESYEELLQPEALTTRTTRIWPELGTTRADRYRKEVDDIRERFQDEADDEDVAMVSEYSDEIFEYMHELEDNCMPSADYMDCQHEINWSMRQTLVDWMAQVHLRYHLLPETLWIAVNIVDRFLSKRVVSLVKLQLVGVTAMFIAAKYEEILAPSVEEFVFMTEKGYTREEILKGERIVLQTLEFKISHYCSPYSWMRKISRADDYDVQTRTLSKFLTELTLLDHRFLRVKPSMVAAIGMYTARRMLGGNWGEAFVYYSGFTEEHLLPGHAMLVQKLVEVNPDRQCICKKYAHKKFLKASSFAVDWARRHYEEDGNMEGMVLEE